MLVSLVELHMELEVVHFELAEGKSEGKYPIQMKRKLAGEKLIVWKMRMKMKMVGQIPTRRIQRRMMWFV